MFVKSRGATLGPSTRPVRKGSKCSPAQSLGHLLRAKPDSALSQACVVALYQSPVVECARLSGAASECVPGSARDGLEAGWRDAYVARPDPAAVHDTVLWQRPAGRSASALLSGRASCWP